MANEKEIAVLLSLKDQLTQELEKTKTSAMGSIKAMSVAMLAFSATVTTAMTLAVRDAQNYAVELDKVSKTTGISTEELSKLGYAAKQEHASMEALTTGLKFLSRNMLEARDGGGQAAQSFTDLGIRVKDSDGKLRNAGDVILEVADKFKGMTNETEKSGLAMKLFGRSGTELVPFLNMGSEEIKRLGNEAQRLGIVLSKDNVAAFKKFEDSQDAVKAGFMGLKIAAAEHVLPVLQSLIASVQKIIEWFNGLSTGTKGLITDLIIFSGIWAGLVGTLGSIILAMPVITAGFIALRTVLVSHPIFAIATALALASAAVLEYMARQKDEQNALIETGKDLQSLNVRHYEELEAIKEKLKNIKLDQAERAKLETQYVRIKKAIKDNIEEMGNEKTVTKQLKDTHVDLTKKMLEWQDSLHDLTYETLPKTQDEWQKYNDAVQDNKDRLDKDKDSLTGMGQITKDYTDGLPLMTKETKTTTDQQESLNSAMITFAQNVVNAGTNFRAVFKEMVKLAIEFTTIMTNPIIGSALTLVTTVWQKLFSMFQKKPKLIDTEQEDLDNFLLKQKKGWGQFGVDISQAMSNAFNFTDLKQGWSDLMDNMKSMFQQQIVSEIFGRMMREGPIAQILANISSHTGNLIENPQNTTGWLALLQQDFSTLTSAIKPMFEGLFNLFQGSDIFGAFNVPAMASGGFVMPQTGGTLIRVAEAGEGEYIIPASKMGGKNVVININAGTVVGDRASISKLVRELIAPELNRLKLKTGETF